MKSFLKPDNPILYKLAQEVKKEDLKSKWFLQIIKDMKSVAGISQHKDTSKPTMVGLAAPQIGYPYRIAFVDTNSNIDRDNKTTSNLFIINPKILKYSKDKIKGKEGCYSSMTDKCDFMGNVERSKSITVQYMDVTGQIIKQEIKGFTSVIFQHEIDHLNGKVFVHRVKNEKDLHIVFRSEYKKHKENFKKRKRTVDPKIYLKEIAKTK